MKRLLITICAALAIMGASAQRTTTTQQAKPLTQAVTKLPTDSKQQNQSKGKEIKPGTPTPHTYKGYPVYQGAKGGYYVIRTSQKTGNQYKQYIKPDKFDK